MKRSREPGQGPGTDIAQQSAEIRDPSTDTSGFREELQRPAKLVGLDQDSHDDHVVLVEMKCSLPPHRDTLIFNSYSEYEAHYNKDHMNRCHECHKNFPSAHLLNVHIEEFHDPLVIIRREKGEHTVRLASPVTYCAPRTNRRSILALSKVVSASV